MSRRSLSPSIHFILLIIICIFSFPAKAATFTVTNLNDSGVGSLRQAILDANTQPGADTITFATGLSGILPVVSTLRPIGVLDLIGPGASVLTILSNGTDIFVIDRSDAIITISGLTITNGRNGIWNLGNLTVNDCRISKNFGTGILSDRSGSDVTINNSTLSENDSYGVYNYYGDVTINNSTLSDNALAGVYNYYGQATVNGSTLSGNRSRGLGNEGGSFTVNRSAIVNNLTGSAYDGGGISSIAAPSLTVINSTLLGNEARNGCGGAVYIDRSTNNMFYNNTLSNNLARNGGGLCIAGTSIFNPLNNTLSANMATSQGGGIYIQNGSILMPGNNVVAGNSATPGGSNSGIEIYNAGTFSSMGHNLFGQNGVSGLTNANPAANDRILPGAIGTAIGPLANNGGPTLTYLPVAGGPAIDAGDNALAQSAGLTTDQRGAGFPRIVGGAVDIGAVEVGNPPSAYNPIHSDFDGDGRDDLAGLNSAGAIYYSTNLTGWTRILGTLSRLVAGDFDGDRKADLAGVNSAGAIYYTTDLTTWHNIPGALSHLVAGDFNGDGKADLAGVNSAGAIYYTTNLTNWTYIPGTLSRLVAGDFNGDGKADLAGLNSAGSIYYSTNLTNWTQISGALSRLASGNYNGDLYADLAGLNGAGSIYYSTGLSTWTWIGGQLSRLAGDTD